MARSLLITVILCALVLWCVHLESAGRAAAESSVSDQHQLYLKWHHERVSYLAN